MNHHGDFALGATEENHGPASEVLLHPQVHCRYITTKSGDLLLLNHTFWCYDVLDTSSIDYQTLRVERWMTPESSHTWCCYWWGSLRSRGLFHHLQGSAMNALPSSSNMLCQSCFRTLKGQLKNLSLTACENGPTEKLYHEILDRYDIL